MKEREDEQGNKIEEIIIPLSLKIAAVFEYIGVLLVCIFISSYLMEFQYINFQIVNLKT